MKKKHIEKDIVIYQAKGGAIEVRVDSAHETFQLTQEQVAG